MATKEYPQDGEKKAYERKHISFQSTSSCNFGTVNCLNNVALYVRTKERGRGDNKRRWAIEMNEARDYYLKSYGKLDTIDGHIRAHRIFYKSWKYWHNAKNHGLGFVLLTTYDMYRECAEGDLDPDWKCNIVPYWDFLDELATQMLQYNPQKLLLPGDEKLRLHTQINKKRKRLVQRDYNKDPEEGMSEEQIRVALIGKRNVVPRLCGDLKNIGEHVDAMITKTYASKCEVCGKTAYSYCSICKVTLHFFQQKGKNLPTHKRCFLLYHDTGFFGLSRSDTAVFNKKLNAWIAPTCTVIEKNRTFVRKVIKKIEKGDTNDTN